jgi:hypothetical protein
MSKRKYVKKEKEIEIVPISKEQFNKDLLFLTKVKPPKKEETK